MYIYIFFSFGGWEIPNTNLSFTLLIVWQKFQETYFYKDFLDLLHFLNNSIE